MCAEKEKVSCQEANKRERYEFHFIYMTISLGQLPRMHGVGESNQNLLKILQNTLGMRGEKEKSLLPRSTQKRNLRIPFNQYNYLLGATSTKVYLFPLKAA
jgi:hypothetical protein